MHLRLKLCYVEQSAHLRFAKSDEFLELAKAMALEDSVLVVWADSVLAVLEDVAGVDVYL